MGIDQNTQAGLAWVLEAANRGICKAQAVVRRLHRAYGQEYHNQDRDTTWLRREARSNSPWALEELWEEDKELYYRTLRNCIFAHPSAGESPRLFEEIRPFLKLGDARLLNAQLQSGRERSIGHRLRKSPPLAAAVLRWACCFGTAEIFKLLLEALRELVSIANYIP